MIKIENVETYGWEAAIRGMRNPKNSWEKSDSIFSPKVLMTSNSEGFYGKTNVLGHYDLQLAKALAAAGDEHGKFARMLMVSFDVVAPLYFYKEFDTFKIGTVANSCSTMHKIHSKKFVVDDFSREHLNTSSLIVLNNVIEELNRCRDLYNKTSDKNYWWQMIQLLPSSYNQRRTVMLNYQVLKRMYHQRKKHKLDEWREFCYWIQTLPYAKELIVGEVDENTD